MVPTACVGLRVYLLGEGDEARGLDRDVSKAREAVLGEPGLGDGEAQPHLLEYEELYFEEVDGRAADMERRASHGRSRDEEHAVNRVFGDAVGDVSLDIRYAPHGQGRRPDALDADPQGLQEAAELLHLVVGRGIFDDALSLDPRGGKERVLGGGVALLIEDDLGGREPLVLDMETVGERIDRDTEALERPEVRAHGARAEGAAARLGDIEGARGMDQRADEEDDAASLRGCLGIDSLE